MKFTHENTLNKMIVNDGRLPMSFMNLGCYIFLNFKTLNLDFVKIKETSFKIESGSPE